MDENLKTRVMSGEKMIDCPCCDQRIEMYRCTISLAEIRTFIWWHKKYGLDVGSSKRLAKKRGLTSKFTQLKHWGIIEKMSDGLTVWERDHPSSSLWRITPKGEAFFRRRIRICKYRYVVDDRVIKNKGPKLYIDEFCRNFSFLEVVEQVDRI